MFHYATFGRAHELVIIKRHYQEWIQWSLTRSAIKDSTVTTALVSKISPSLRNVLGRVAADPDMSVECHFRKAMQVCIGIPTKRIATVLKRFGTLFLTTVLYKV